MIDGQVLALARKVVEANVAAGRMVALAESCTGGLVAGALTEIPGSSAMFDRSFVTYSNEAKLESVGVSRDILETFGAVSEAVAWAMAHGALAHSHADVAVAISGIAGPDGGTPKKPVGTVVFARALKADDRKKVVADVKHYGDLGRGEVRRQAVICALELLMPDPASADVAPATSRP